MKMRFALPLIAALLICAAGTVSAEVINLHPEMKVLLVDCRVNGKEAGKFLLNPAQYDTTVISPELVKKLGLQDSGGRTTIDLRVSGTDLGEMRVAIDRYGNYSHAVLGPLAGMLGGDVASKFKITLDYGNSRARLTGSTKGDMPEAGNKKVVLRMETAGNVPIITLKANGKEIKALVDICSLHSTLLPDAATRTGGGRGLELAAGAVKLGSATFIVSSHPRCERIMAEHGVNIDAVLGVDFLADYTVTIDLLNGILVLEPGEAQPAKAKTENGGEFDDNEYRSAGLGVIYEFDEEKKTAKIVKVLPNSPARAQRLKAGDIIEKVNGLQPRSAGHLSELLAPDSKVKLAMRRGEWTKDVSVKLRAEGDSDVPQNTGEIKKLLLKSGFSREQIKTLLELFELRIKDKEPAPDAGVEGAVKEMKKAGFKKSQAEALAKLFKMKKDGLQKPGDEPKPESNSLEEAIQSALERGVSQEMIDEIIRICKMMKYPDERIVKELNKVRPKEAPGE